MKKYYFAFLWNTILKEKGIFDSNRHSSTMLDVMFGPSISLKELSQIQIYQT